MLPMLLFLRLIRGFHHPHPRSESLADAIYCYKRSLRLFEKPNFTTNTRSEFEVIHNLDAGWDELERMAQAASAADAQMSSQYPTPETIERWKKLFGYSHMEAVRLISDQRGDVTRERITDDHWDLIKDEKEALGYDREAYEHSLQLPKVFKGQSATIPTTGADGETMLLFRLGGLLDSPEKVKEVAGLKELPIVREGMSEMGMVKFCAVDKEAQKKLEDWLTQQSVLQK